MNNNNFKIVIVAICMIVGVLHARSRYEVINATGETLERVKPDLENGSISSEKRQEYYKKYNSQKIIFKKKQSRKQKNSKADKSFVINSSSKKYIEVRKNDVFKVCVDSSMSFGTWLYPETFWVDDNNCFVSTAPNFTRSISLKYEQVENGEIRLDSFWVLVDQVYVKFDNHKVRLQTKDKDSEWQTITCVRVSNGPEYIATLSKELIVDITEVTLGDKWKMDLLSNRTGEYSRREKTKENYPNVDPVPAYFYTNKRSEIDGFKSAYISSDTVDINALKKQGNLIMLTHKIVYPNNVPTLSRVEGIYLDTCANGYRDLFMEEWVALAKGGAESTFYWGESHDSTFISQYENISDILTEVAQHEPNQYGLYDTFGNAIEGGIVKPIREYSCKYYYNTKEKCDCAMDLYNYAISVYSNSSTFPADDLKYRHYYSKRRGYVPWTSHRLVRQIPSKSCKDN